jgi:hypothetical protein
MRADYRNIIILSILFIFLLNQDLYSNSKSELPNFLSQGSYAQYSQIFSTDEDSILLWNITMINESMIRITINSSGLVFNKTTEMLEMVRGGGTLFVSKNSWEIVEFIHENISQTTAHPIGYKQPFWIPNNITQSIAIDTMYDLHTFPNRSEVLKINSLNIQRDCWVTYNTYGGGNSMERWYDKETGIVLKIVTVKKYLSSEVSCVELINETNLKVLMGSNIDPNGIILGGVIIFIICLISLVTIKKKR